MGRIGTLLVTAVLVSSMAEGVVACGDKFLRIGRQLGVGRYVAIYPAKILIFGPPRSTPSRLRELPDVLKRAGHSTTVVTGSAELSDALQAGKFDLVLAGIEHAADVVLKARSAPSHPDVMPVLINPHESERARAKTVSTCVIDVPSAHKNDALAEIDHRMELRLKAAGNTHERRR